MLKDLLVPEEFLQLDKLKSAIELCDDTSFFSILGSDKVELTQELQHYLKESINNLIILQPNSDAIHEEIKKYRTNKEFIFINLFYQKDSDFIKDLLFYRDFISDYNLKIIILVQEVHYKQIVKTAIDLYNIATFSYLFATYQVDIIKDIDMTDLNKLLEEYKTKKGNLSKKQKISYLGEIAGIYDKNGAIEKSLNYFNKALHISKQIKNIEIITKIKLNLSSLYRKVNQFNIAETYLLECEKYYAIHKNYNDYAQVLHTLSILYLDYHLYEKSLLYNDKLHKQSKEIHDKNLELSSLNNYLSLYHRKRDKEKIDFYWNQAHPLSLELNNNNTTAELYQIKAIDYLEDMDYKEALIYLDRAIRLYQEMNDAFMLNQMYLKISNAYYHLFAYDKSLVYLEWCYKYFINNRLQNEAAMALRLFAFIERAQGYYSNAIEKSLQALKISKSLKDRLISFEILLFISETYNKNRNYKKALDYVNEALKLSNKLKEPNYLNLFSRYADIYKDMGDIDKAYTYYDKAIQSVDILSDNQQNYLNELYGEILFEDNKLDEALNYFNKVLKCSKTQNDLQRILSVEESLGYLYKKIGDINMSKRFFMETINKLKIISPNNKKINILKKEINIEVS